MPLTSNLNADFYKTVVTDPTTGRQRQVIYSTRANLNLAQEVDAGPDVVPVDSGMDLCVYADSVTLLGNVSVPGGDITIVARRLIVPPGQSATLSNTPLPSDARKPPRDPAPALPGASGEAGKPGERGVDNGGAIVVVAEELQCEELEAPGFVRAADGSYFKEVKFHRQDMVTLQEAGDIADARDWQVASAEQVWAAWAKGGLHISEFGLLDDGSVCVPLQNEAGDYKRGVNLVRGTWINGFFYVQSGGLSSSLWIEARGGAGGPGGDGQNGAPGASGKSSVLWAITKGSSVALVRGEHLPPGPGNLRPSSTVPGHLGEHTAGGDGGCGGDGGAGGDGGDGGSITLVLPPAGAAAVVCDTSGGSHGEDGAAGAGGEPGTGGVETVYSLLRFDFDGL